MKNQSTYQIDRRYFHFVGKPCWAHWHCRTHGSSCRPGWTDLQLHQPLVHGQAYSIYLGEIRDRFFFLFTKASEYYLERNNPLTTHQTIKPWYRLFFTTCSSKQNLCRMFTIVARARLTTLIRSHSSCRTSIRSRKKTVHSWMLLAICGQV